MNKKNLAVLGGGLITLSALGAIVCSSVTIYMSNRVTNRVSLVQNDVTALSKAYIKQEEKHTDPEYVIIDHAYEIRDTSAISDAYKNKENSTLTKPEDKETLMMASQLLSQIINDKMSLYEKEVAIHDWIATNITTNNTSLSSIPAATGDRFTPYGVLKSRQAVCVGYATTFKLLMNMVGADCMVEHNTQLGHSWDVVKLDDNQWYIVDLYNDANDDPNGKPVCNHEKFNITNDTLLADNTTFDTSLYPVASGTKYSYAAQNSKKLDDIKNLPKLVKEDIEKQVSETYYELPANADYKYTAAMVNGIHNRINDGNITADGRYINIDDNTTILALKYTYTASDQSDEKNYPDLTKELDKLFGAATNDEAPTDAPKRYK